MRRLLLPLFVLLSACAHAQIVSIYGTFSPIHVSGAINGNSSSGGANTTSFWAPGFGGGATFNVVPIGPVKVGIDLRGSTKPGANGADLILVGPRVGLKVPFVRLKPYVQASGGYLRTRTTLVASPFAGSTFTNSFGAWEILGGVDYSFVPFFDLRLIELGGGKGYNISAAGVSQDYTVSLFTVNTGVVFHF